MVANVAAEMLPRYITSRLVEKVHPLIFAISFRYPLCILMYKLLLRSRQLKVYNAFEIQCQQSSQDTKNMIGQD